MLGCHRLIFFLNPPNGNSLYPPCPKLKYVNTPLPQIEIGYTPSPEEIKWSHIKYPLWCHHCDVTMGRWLWDGYQIFTKIPVKSWSFIQNPYDWKTDIFLLTKFWPEEYCRYSTQNLNLATPHRISLKEWLLCGQSNLLGWVITTQQEINKLKFAFQRCTHQCKGPELGSSNWVLSWWTHDSVLLSWLSWWEGLGRYYK